MLLRWLSLPFSAAAMSCFSEIKFGWCEYSSLEPSQPPSCPDYVFSIAGFQRKLDSHYHAGARPPLLEAFFLVRLHDDYKQSLVDADCPNPLIFALLLASEVSLLAPPWKDLDRAFGLASSAMQLKSTEMGELLQDFAMAASTEGRQLYEWGLRLAKEASPFQQHLMASRPAAWPLQAAIKRVQDAQDALGDAVPLALMPRDGAVPCETTIRALAASFRTACVESAKAPFRVDFVVAHCRETLDWLVLKLQRVPPHSRLLVYEKCGEPLAPEDVARMAGEHKFQSVRQVERPDVGAARGDECSAYLTHILGSYHHLADFTIFLQSDPMDHLHFDFLDLVLRSMAAGTYNVSFLPLNGPRHVRTLTPCLQAVHEEIFKTNLTQLIGPYCCAQFAVSRETIQARSEDFYLKMLGLVDGSRDVDLCGVEGTKRSTQCYGFEFLWHIVFGEEPEPPSREDDGRLPVALRLKHGKEHSRLNWVGMPLARDIPLKMVPDYEHGNPMFAE